MASTPVETKEQEKAEKKELVREEKEKVIPTFKPVTIRDYSKVIFFYPLFIYSGIAWIIEHFFASGIGLAAQGWVALIWAVIFFVNLFVVAFYFPATKFFVLFLVIVVLALVVGLLYVLGIINFSYIDFIIADLLQLELKSKFYGVMTVLIGIVLLFAVLSARFKYIRIEENEVIVKTILIGEMKRYPTASLRYKKEIADVFEYIALGAGRLTFNFAPDTVVILHTVPRVNKVANTIDEMLGVIQVSVAKKP